MKVQNPNMKGTKIRIGARDVQGDEQGIFEVTQEEALKLLNTNGWKPLRTTRVLTDPLHPTPKLPEPSAQSSSSSETEEDEEEIEEDEDSEEEDAEETEEDEEDSEEDEDSEEEEVPPYEQWEYADLVKEVLRRVESDPEFIAPENKKKETIIAAFKADDERVMKTEKATEPA